MKKNLKLNLGAISVAVILAVLISLLVTSVAQAHENRAVGKYRLTVGWVTEPALLNQPNAIDFRVVVSDTQKPVEGLEKTVKVEVTFGARTMPVALAARFGQAGAYAGNIIPTRAGSYIFHFTGQIEGQNIDEKFESGSGRFAEVEDTTTMQFPEKIPSALDAAAQLKAAQESAASAQTAAYNGTAAGVLGILLGGLALLRRK